MTDYKELPRNWKDQYYPLPDAPPFIIEVKQKFGTDIAIILKEIYKKSPRLAKRIYNKIIMYESIYDVVREILDNASLFDQTSQEIINRIAKRVLINYNLEKIIEKIEDESERRRIIEKFLECVREGYLPDYNRLIKTGQCT